MNRARCIAHHLYRSMREAYLDEHRLKDDGKGKENERQHQKMMKGML